MLRAFEIPMLRVSPLTPSTSVSNKVANTDIAIVKAAAPDMASKVIERRRMNKVLASCIAVAAAGMTLATAEARVTRFVVEERVPFAPGTE